METSPGKNLSMSEKDESMMKVGEEKEESSASLMQKLLRGKKYLIPAGLFLTMLPQKVEAKNILAYKNGYKMACAVRLTERIAPQFITTGENGGKEIDPQTLQEPIGNYYLNNEEFLKNSKDAKYSELLEKDIADFDKKIQQTLKNNPGLLQKISKNLHSFYKQLFPAGYEKRSQITIDQGEEKPTVKPISKSNILEISDFLTRETELSDISNLDDKTRISLTKEIIEQESDVITLGAQREVQEIAASQE